ncbi:MAG: 3-dehydroquinate dehydratase [Candidatus Muiribacterium halophilum]|uniref:3-dehydroquinate dehydratase n=1 Tax=Muiribacterium halophilum TaxID=2053465 RepID=A0A2N5ZLI6_MUIH1|nr:MAG: 3-dehydroquinate dehydratase [Candidatus Muirbacterium halophilum]
MIKINNIEFCKNNKIIIDSLTHTFEKGKINFIIGENGVGKTTLLNILGGVFDSTGVKSTDYGDICTENHQYKAELGFLMETPFFYYNLTSDEFIDLVLSLRKKEVSSDEKKRWYELFKMIDFTNIPISSLSKGARQKTAIISTLIHDPEYILMDEPVNGLDPVGVKILKEILVAEKKKNKTIIVSTHILEIAEKLADDVLVIKDGKKIASGNISDLRKNADEELEDIFLRLTENHDYEKVLSLI